MFFPFVSVLPHLSSRCLIKDFELRPNVLDLLQHVFLQQIRGKEKVLQKHLMEHIDLNQQLGNIEKTRYILLNTLYIWFLPVRYALTTTSVPHCCRFQVVFLDWRRHTGLLQQNNYSIDLNLGQGSAPS